MAKGTAAAPSGLPPSSVVPQPPANLDKVCTLATWKAHDLIHRIHSDAFGPAQFNPSFGNARFSPIESAAGNWVPTLYGATNFEGAAMETVFHDVPFAQGFKPYGKRKLAAKHYSILDPQTDLLLLDLRGLAMRKVGVDPKLVIETEKDTYPQTRLWSKACHAQCPTAQGMIWVSRQHNTTLAIVLFEDRIRAGTLLPHRSPESLTAPGSGHYANLVFLARQIGVNIV